MKAMSAYSNMNVFWVFIILCLQRVDTVNISQNGVGNGVNSNVKTAIKDNRISTEHYVKSLRKFRTRKSINDLAIDATTKSNTSGCQFNISQGMKDKFRDYVNNKKINFMFILMKFSTNHRKNYNNYKSDKYFYPLYLTWTYKGGPGAGFPILSYPYDFKLRSLGFLSWHVLDRVIININVIPKNCNFTWGESQMMVNLLKAVRTITSERMEHNQTSYWCYGIKFNLSVVRRWLAHVTGMESESTGYMCSTPDDPETFSETYHQTRMPYFLNLLSVALFSFTPLFLFIFDGRRTLPQSTSTRPQLANGENSYEVIQGTDCESDNDEPILIMGDQSPFTWFSLLKKLLRLTAHSPHPVGNRLMKCFVLLVILPSVVFVDVWVHYTYLWGSLITRARQDIPLGYFAIPLGYELSRKNWLYFMGGPYVIYGLYFFLSTILICIPDDLASVIVSQVDRGDATAVSGCLLFLPTEVIEDRGGIQYTNNPATSYKKLSDAIKCRIYMLLHPKFWLYFWSVWRGRLRVCYRRLPSYGLMKTIACICLFIPAFVIITVLFLVDVLCCVAYYGIPIVFFTKTILHNSVEYFTNRLMNRGSKLPGCDKFKECALRFVFLFIITYVLACTYTILATTIQIGIRTFMFVFYGILAFPSEAIMSIIFTLIGLIYVYKSLTSFNEAYNNYLYMTITISLELEGGRLSETLTEANDYISQSTAVSPYVFYKNGVPGIHGHLYAHIIERYRPVRIRVFLTLIYLAIVGGFMYTSMSVIQSFNRQSELPIMVKLIATVGAGLLPRLFQMCWGSTNQKAEDEQFKYKLRESVVKYWERHHLYVPLIERK
ncbi:unnamed protein product [Owenia fusiformis]|uniref:Uncharacterized protein n=1 Tax=Owenia fusiformis TaxID=6347 RepID=A0A8S4NRK2_OWEFU|nr:unnamed protein product [Owenia fusiformis]